MVDLKPTDASSLPRSARTDGAEALRVFLDCSACDFDFLRREITYVNYVLDRNDAQVHVLVTTQSTGGGGRAFTLAFFGLEGFEGIDDELQYFSDANDTDDDIRRGLATMIQSGLIRYVAMTPLIEHIEITYRGASAGRLLNAQPEDDPWNFWLFRTSLNVRLDSEESQAYRSFGGSFSGNRTTTAWKIQLGGNFAYDENRFELSESRTLTTVSRSNALTGSAIASVGDHGGVGVGGSVLTSTFNNQELTLRLASAVEYNFYPYSQSTRRQLSVNYALGINYFDYENATIFDRVSEQRTDHGVTFSYDRKEPWGNSGLAVELSQFLSNRKQYRIVTFGHLNFRLARGLFLTLSGDGSLIRDQIFLARGGASDEDILLKLRRLATNYRYGLRVGITHSFGSIYNNVVNSRFGGSNGGFVRAF